MRIKNKILSLFWPITVILYFIFTKDNYLKSTGWINSLKNNIPCDEQGNYIPWMNYSVVSLLNDRLHKKMQIFEYGSGYSTLYFAEKVKYVCSVEYDSSWYEIIKNKLPGNSKIIHQKNDVNGEYCRAIAKFNKKYDLVIVDGRDRVNCVAQSFEHLTNDGVIILDDCDRSRYQDALKFSLEKGYKILRLEGMTPTNYKKNASAIIYKTDNSLGL